MKKSTPFLFLAVLLLAAMLMGCSSPFFSGVGKGAVYGRVYNGLTRTLITSTTNTGLAGKLTYYDKDKKASTTVAAKFSGDFYYFAEIPTLTPYVMEFADGTTFRTWFSELAGITEAPTASAGSQLWFLGGNPATLGNVYLYPSNVTPGDVTIRILDNDNGAQIKSAGTVQLTPTNAPSPSNTAALNMLTNHADVRSPVISGTLVDGSVKFAGTTLTLGVTYSIRIYGVTGYNGTTDTVSSDTASATTKDIALTEIATNLSLASVSDVNSLGNKITAGNAVTFYFNQDIELDPNVVNTARLNGITTNDTDDDGTVNVLAAFSGNPNAATPVASNHLTVTVAGNALTVTLKAGCFTTEDTADDLEATITTSSIGLRAKGSTRTYQTLNNLIPLGGNYTFTVRYTTTLE